MTTQYELLEPIEPRPEAVSLKHCEMPELVHLEDPAHSVMNDFSKCKPMLTKLSTSMDDAHNEMRLTNTHFLVVLDDDKQPVGIITSEDILGEKPIQLLQANRYERHQITVKILMTQIKDIPCLSLDEATHARVGNIVNTLKALKSHFCLVIQDGDDAVPTLLGLFSTTQISKQLHTEIESGIAKAQSVSELSHRSKD